MTAKRVLFVTLIAALYLLHQDTWFWFQAQPLVFGFFPIGLFYHACYTLAAMALMALLARYAWPHGLEQDTRHQPPAGDRD